MKPTLIFQELAINIVARNLNPTLLTPDFLKIKGIVPTDWTLSEHPENTSHSAKIKFTNEVIISTHLDTITFSEKLEETKIQSAKIPPIVRKYVETISNLDYELIAINPSSFWVFEEKNKEDIHPYIANVLLVGGAWQEPSLKPLTSTLNLAYTLKHGEFLLKIEDIQLTKHSDKSLQFGVLFSGDFSYKILGNTASKKMQILDRFLNSWQEDFKIYQDIVKNKFLSVE